MPGPKAAGSNVVAGVPLIVHKPPGVATGLKILFKLITGDKVHIVPGLIQPASVLFTTKMVIVVVLAHPGGTALVKVKVII